MVRVEFWWPLESLLRVSFRVDKSVICVFEGTACHMTHHPTELFLGKPN